MISTPVHDVIDRYIRAEDLSDVERRELREIEATIRTAVEGLRGVRAPDLTPRVMSAVSLLPPRHIPTAQLPGRIGEAFRWLWARHDVTVRFRPALLGSFAILLFLSIGLSSDRAPTALPQAREASPPSVYIQFRLEATGASRVALAGSFTEWNPAYELLETSPGTWSIMLPLPPGVHDYAFLVDGLWVADPHVLQVSDGFGGTNNRIALPNLPAGETEL